jgi:hypothetical protein
MIMSTEAVDFRPSDGHEWSQFAYCAEPDAPNMFPHPQDPSGVALARNRCMNCPVRTECLTEALQRGEQFGVWGGLTTDERISLRRQNTRLATEKGRQRLSMPELAIVAIYTQDVTAA